MKKKLLLSAWLCCMLHVVVAQVTFKGVVVDESGKTVPEAVVRLEKTSFSTVADDKGEFVLSNVPSGDYTIQASAMNFTTGRFPVTPQSTDLKLVIARNYLNLNEVVVTGTGTYHRLKDTPTPVEVLTAKDIERTGSATFEDALSALSPTISTKGSYSIVMGGLRNKQVLILIDGKKLSGDVGGDNDLERIDMSNVKRIEIVKGGASSLYGSEAMGGVINIITKTPANNVDFTSSYRVSKYGTINQTTNLGVKFGKFTSQTNYQRRESKGWQLSKYEEKALTKPTRDTLVETNKQAMAAYRSNVVSQKFTYDPTNMISLYTKGTYYDKRTDRPVSDYTYDMFYKDYNMAAGGEYHFRKHVDYITFDAYYDNYEYEKGYLKETKSNNITYKVGDRQFTKRQRYFNSTLKGVFSIGENHKLNTGLDFVNDYLRNPESMEQAKSAYTMAWYAQDEIKIIDRLSVVAGFRLIHHEVFKNKFTPKLSAMYALDHFNFRASYAAGFRTPNLLELYYDKLSGTTISQGNKDLIPEKSNYYSLNAEYISKYFTMSVTGYTNNIHDIIDRTVVDLTDDDKANGVTKRYLYNNVSKARTQGIDVSMNAFLGYGFSLGLGYSYLDAVNRVDNVPLYGAGRHTGTVNANWNKEWSKYKLNINLNGRLQSKVFYSDENARSYNLWNIATTHSFSGSKAFVIEPGFGVENIFNFKDERPFGSRYATTSSGRTVYASLTVKFKQ